MDTRKILSKKNLFQFSSYILVGGIATVVEWVLFYLFVCYQKWDQNLSLIIAYTISTLVNMLMGKLLTFRNSSVVNKSTSKTKNLVKETLLIYLVSAIGCGLNLIFLDMFTYSFHMHSLTAKILTTGIIFVGNFLVRKLGIYRDNLESAINEKVN